MDSDPTAPASPLAAGTAALDDGLDPAQRSLADALRVSFWVLKVAMVLLLILYLASGVFNVSQQQTALRLRFGRVVGEPGEQALQAGGPYFSLPYPFERVVTLPAAPQQITLDQAFWYQTPHPGAGLNEQQQQARAGPLNPEKDGYLLTGDAQIVHARWSVTYAIEDPIKFLACFGDPDSARGLVRNIAEQSIVFATAATTADQLIRSQKAGQAVRHAQQMLDALQTGIRITDLSARDPAYPLPVRTAVRAVLNAESLNAKLVEQAQELAARLLVGTAGEAYEPLLTLIDDYELATHGTDVLLTEELSQQLDEAFTSLAVPAQQGQATIGGAVAEMINEAMTYRTEVVAKVRGEADYFNSLLPEYRKNPRIVVNRLWQDAKQRILTGDIETIYLPPGQTYLDISRDPQVQQQRERQRLTGEEQDRPRGN